MLPDLQHLIDLQRIDDRIEAARRRIAAIPQDLEALEAQTAAARQAVAAAQQRMADHQAARRAIEKDLAVVQERLAKFKDQIMAVKTNREYTAMLTEIATAERQIREYEDRLLENLVEADTLAAELKGVEAELAAAISAAESGRARLAQEREEMERQIERATADRAAVAAVTGREALALFEHIATRRSPVVAEARNGLCTVCHVRLRPQVDNQIRRQDSIVQCDSCQRILYFVLAGAPASEASTTPS